MKKNNQDIYLVHYSKRTSENIEKISEVVYSVATGECETDIQCCQKTYEDLLVEGNNIFDSSYHFDWYLFPCHCVTEACLNFDPLENKYDALFFLHFCRCFKKGSKYSKEQIGNAPDIRMAICKKAIDQWFDPKRHETYYIRLLKILQHLDYTLRSLMILEDPEAHRYFEFILKEICLPYFSDTNNDRYKKLYTYDKNFNDNIAFLNYLSQEFNSVQESGISDEKEVLHKAYDNIFNNINDGKGGLKKGKFYIQKNDTAGKYSYSDLDKEISANNTKEKLKDQEKIENRINPGEISETKESQKSKKGYSSGNLDKKTDVNTKKEKLKDQETRENQQNKVSFWQHFLFVLFFFLMCLSLFLCFEIQSLYFLIPFVIFFVVDLYFGFKNYCSYCCRTAKNIELPLINKDRSTLVGNTDHIPYGKETLNSINK